MSVETNEHEERVFEGGIKFPESALARDGRTLINVLEKEPLDRIASAIFKVLQDSNPSFDAIRGIVLRMNKQGKLTEQEILWVIKNNNKWSKYLDDFTIKKVHELCIWEGNNGSQTATERGENTSEASNSSSSLPISNPDIKDMITKVNWRKPEAKPTVESIKYYFINNFDTNAFQRAPNKVNSSWGYKPMIHSDKNIWRHLETAINPTFNKPFTYGVYEKNKEDKGKWICFDIDADKDDKRGSNMIKAYEIIGYFESRGICPMFENASEGTESYHVWIFCEPTDIMTLKTIGEDARNTCHLTSKDCELFPKCSPNMPLGNPVRIPFGLNRKRNKKSIIMSYDKGAAIALYKLLLAQSA